MDDGQQFSSVFGKEEQCSNLHCRLHTLDKCNHCVQMYRRYEGIPSSGYYDEPLLIPVNLH